MSKKSQITAFILIGIVVLAIVGAVAYFTSYKYKKVEQVPPSMQAIKAFTDECLQETAESAILLAGVQGGVIYFSDVLPNTPTFYSYSTYWYEAGRDTSISKEFIENEINTYIEQEIEERCLKGYESFHENLQTGELSADTQIKENSVELYMNYPVTLTQGDTTTMISRFAAVVPVKFGKAIDIANSIVDLEIQDPDYIRLSELGDMDMMVVPYIYSDDIMLYSVVDEENEVKGVNFKLIFASRFEDESSGNRDPKILNADNLLLVQGVETDYKFAAFDADNNQLKFASVGRFKVGEDGTFRFTPDENDVGEHIITVMVDDGNGGHDSETIKVLVIGV
jgi:hypothetical protein